MRVAILDDLHRAYEGTTGVSRLRDRAEVQIFTSHRGSYYEPIRREVRLKPKVRKVLEARCRAPSTAQRDVRRARIVLLAAEGRSTRSIGRGMMRLRDRRIPFRDARRCRTALRLCGPWQSPPWRRGVVAMISLNRRP
jgi:hypothetical protein